MLKWFNSEIQFIEQFPIFFSVKNGIEREDLFYALQNENTFKKLLR